jgi:hypothetical protein
MPDMCDCGRYLDPIVSCAIDGMRKDPRVKDQLIAARALCRTRYIQMGRNRLSMNAP